jgi:hypothetical protein
VLSTCFHVSDPVHLLILCSFPFFRGDSPWLSLFSAAMVS